MYKKIMVLFSLLLILGIGMCTISANAVDNTADIDTEPPVYTQPQTEEYTEPETEEEPVYTEPETEYVEPTAAPTEKPNYDYTEPQTYADPDDDEPAGNYTNNDYTERTTSDAKLYDTDDVKNTDTLNDDDWKSILLNLKNASNNSNDGGDFGDIQKADASASDDSQWILYCGFVFIAISIGGFVFSVFSWKKQKKAFASAKGGTVSAAGTGKYSDKQKKSKGKYSSQRSKSDYGDNYSSKPSRRKKYDTTKIDLPIDDPKDRDDYGDGY